MIEKWRKIIDEGYGCAISMDLSKAFNTVNHELHANGFSKDAFFIVLSYLSTLRN